MKPLTRRRAVSLIELMIVMSLSSTLLFIAVAWIHQSMKLASTMRSRTDHHATLLHLSRQLRDDVQHGQSMRMEDETQLVIAMASGGSVVYTIIPAGVSRQVNEADRVTAGERYSLNSPLSARWDASELPDWISLIVDRGAAAPVSPGPLESAKRTPPGPHVSPAVADLHVRTGVGRALRWGRAKGEDER